MERVLVDLLCSECGDHSSHGTRPCRSGIHLPLYQDRALQIRLSVFLTAALCVGLPVLVWALRVLWHHRKHGGRVSAFVIFLVLSDLLELVLSPVLMMNVLGFQLLRQMGVRCSEVLHLVSGLRFCGLLFHQLVAIERTLSLTRPLCSTLSLPCSLSVCFIMWISVIICEFYSLMKISLVLSLAPAGLLITVYVLDRTSPPNPDHSPAMSGKPRKMALTVAMATLTGLYCPLFVSIFVNFFTTVRVPGSLWIMIVSVMGLRLIIDPFLCVLVCTGNLRSQIPHRPVGPTAATTYDEQQK